MRRHAAYLVEFYGDEDRGCRDIRKHIAWYLKGFPAGGTVRSSLALVDSLAALDRLLDGLDPDCAVARRPGRGTAGQGGQPAPRHPARGLAELSRPLARSTPPRSRRRRSTTPAA